jgi:hypothetical protein
MVASLLDRAASFGRDLRQPAEVINLVPISQVQKGLDLRYEFWRNVYNNKCYTNREHARRYGGVWTGYPKTLRAISLVSKTAVDWWAEHVYPGVWTRDGLKASNGDPNMLPYDDDTSPELRLCSQQAFSWANAPVFLETLVHKGAMLGDVFTEVEIHYNEADPSSNKVYPVVQDPSHVVELELNARGDVKMYRLAIPRWDSVRRRSYLWGKKVTKDEIITYYDDDEYSYIEGQPARIENPWGFPPASWTPHRYAGGLHGAPVMDVVISTVAEYDAALGSSNDYIHRFIRQGVFMATKDPKGAQDFFLGMAKARDEKWGGGNEWAGLESSLSERETIPVQPVPEDAKLMTLIQNLGLSDADVHIGRVRTEIEEALPEIVFIRRIQAMDQVTKPGAIALVSQVQGKLNRVAANYDLTTIKMAQMCAAIGGELIRSGEWGPRGQLSAQQRLFEPFDLRSYAQGDLSMGFTPREILPSTFSELIDEAIKLESVKTAVGLKHAGFSDEEIYGKDNIPTVPLGMLEAMRSSSVTGGNDAAAVGDALARQFSRGLTPGIAPGVTSGSAPQSGSVTA